MFSNMHTWNPFYLVSESKSEAAPSSDSTYRYIVEPFSSKRGGLIIGTVWDRLTQYELNSASLCNTNISL